MSVPSVGLVISARQTTRVLWAAMTALALAHAAVSYVHHGWDHAQIFGIRRLFDLGAEQNFPSMFSAALFVLDALLLFFIHGSQRNARPPRYHERWLFLGWLFLFLSLDEAIGLHELLTRPARLLPGGDRVSYVAWVIPYAAGVSVLAVYLGRWFASLERIAQREFALAAVLFLSGAVGVELLEGRMVARDIGAANSLRFEFLVAIEDLLEMSGLICFAGSLLRYLERLGGGGASISFAPPVTTTPSRSTP